MSDLDPKELEIRISRVIDRANYILNNGSFRQKQFAFGMLEAINIIKNKKE